jgi:hypothetical protein
MRTLLDVLARTDLYTPHNLTIHGVRNGTKLERNISPGAPYEWYVVSRETYGDIAYNVTEAEAVAAWKQAEGITE